MRLLILLALVTIPVAVTQFYSADTFAISSKTALQEPLFDKAILPSHNSRNKNAVTDKKNQSKKQTIAQISEPEEISFVSPPKTKRVRLMKSHQSAKTMNLLSVLLLLKDKNR